MAARYTEKEKAFILKCIKDGLTNEAISDRLGRYRTTEAIRRFRVTNAPTHSRRKYTAWEKDTISRLFNEGKSDEEIHAQLPHRTVAAIQRQRSTMGDVKINRKCSARRQKVTPQHKRSTNATKHIGMPFVATAYQAPDKVAAVYHTAVVVLVGVVAALVGYLAAN